MVFAGPETERSLDKARNVGEVIEAQLRCRLILRHARGLLAREKGFGRVTQRSVIALVKLDVFANDKCVFQSSFYVWQARTVSSCPSDVIRAARTVAVKQPARVSVAGGQAEMVARIVQQSDLEKADDLRQRSSLQSPDGRSLCVNCRKLALKFRHTDIAFRI